MKKIILLFLVFLTVSSTILAQVVPDDIYRQIDSALSEQSIPKISTILQKSTATAWYPRLESYLLKKARQMIINNELEQAKAIALVLIDNNLDNNEAVDLYQSVQSTIVKRETEQKKAQEQESLSNFKQAATDTKIKQEIAKTYKTATNTATGKKVYLDQDFNNTYRSYTWDFLLGLANVGFILDPDDQSLKYGLSGSGSFYYHGEGFTIGADIEGGAMLLSLFGDQALNWSGGLVMSVATNSISKYFVFRAGYDVFGYNSGSKKKTESTFATPVAGLGFRDVRMGESGRFKMAVDYYPGHFMEKDMLVALGANMGFSFVLAKMQDFDIQLQTGINDVVLLFPSGIQNDVKLILAIGVGNYE